MINNMIKTTTKQIVTTAKTFNKGDSAEVFREPFDNIRHICISRATSVKQAYQSIVEAVHYVGSRLKDEHPSFFFNINENKEEMVVYIKIGMNELESAGFTFVPIRDKKFRK